MASEPQPFVLPVSPAQVQLMVHVAASHTTSVLGGERRAHGVRDGERPRRDRAARMSDGDREPPEPVRRLTDPGFSQSLDRGLAILAASVAAIGVAR